MDVVVLDVVVLDVVFDPTVQLALNPVKLGPATGGAVGVPEGYVETNWPPLTTEGRGPTDVTNLAALW